MSQPISRRDVLSRSTASLAWLALGLPETIWALQPGEELVTLTDYTNSFQIAASEATPRTYVPRPTSPPRRRRRAASR